MIGSASAWREIKSHYCMFFSRLPLLGWNAFNRDELGECDFPVQSLRHCEFVGVIACAQCRLAPSNSPLAGRTVSSERIEGNLDFDAVDRLFAVERCICYV